MCRVLHHRIQAHHLTRQTLRQPRQRQWRQRPQPWISANGLAIVEQHDRLAIRRYLDRSQGNPLGNHRLAQVLQFRPEQAHAHAVGAGVQGPGRVEGIEQALPAELADLRAQHHIQRRFAGKVRDQFTGQVANRWRPAGKAQ
ncbi:hypothetical protein D3C86_1646080 [compost metagenome]